MTSFPVHTGQLFNMAHAQFLAVAFLKRFLLFSVDSGKPRKNSSVDVELLLRLFSVK